MRKFLTFILVLILSGCSYINTKNEKNPPSKTELTCKSLKRKIIFNETSRSSLLGVASATEKAELLKLYNKYDCKNFEKRK